MFRTAASLLALVAFAGVGNAQPGQLPLSPGVRPASPIGPGMPYPNPTPRFAPLPGGFHGGPFVPQPFPAFVPVFNPFLPFGYGYGGYWPYGYGYNYPVIIEPPPVMPAPRPEPGVVLANEFPAVLTVQFPAAAEVWLNGKKIDGKSEEQVLTSPVLKPGQTFTFEVKARWSSGGKTYETNRSVSLGSGDRSRLLVVSGTEVKE